jgi:hypothetical protein
VSRVYGPRFSEKFNVMARLRNNREDLLEKGELTEAVLPFPVMDPTTPVSTETTTQLAEDPVGDQVGKFQQMR